MFSNILEVHYKPQIYYKVRMCEIQIYKFQVLLCSAKIGILSWFLLVVWFAFYGEWRAWPFGRLFNRLSGKCSARSTASDWLFMANIGTKVWPIKTKLSPKIEFISWKHANHMQLSAMPLPKAGYADCWRWCTEKVGGWWWEKKKELQQGRQGGTLPPGKAWIVSNTVGNSEVLAIFMNTETLSQSRYSSPVTYTIVTHIEDSATQYK